MTNPINPASSPSSSLTGQSAADTIQNNGLGGILTDFPSSTSGAVPAGAPSDGHRWPIRLALTTSAMYDDNIYISRGETTGNNSNVAHQKIGDYIWRVAPTIAYQSSSPNDQKQNFLEIDFTPTFIEFTDNTNEDSIDYNANLSYVHRWNKLTLSVAQQYEKLSGATIQAGTFVDREIYTTRFALDYNYSDKLEFTSNFGQTITNYADPSYTNVNEWTEDLYFLYRLTPKLQVGFGPKIGFEDIIGQPNQIYEQFLGRMIYDISGKTQIFVAGGAELREYQSSPQGTIGDKISPVFQTGITYAPFDSTTITLAGYRQISPSYTLGGENLTSTGVDITGRQRFFHRYFVSLSLGYENDSYDRASAAVGPATREDNYYFIRPAFDYEICEWASVNVGYQHQGSSSNESGASFTDNQVSIQCRLQY